MTSDLHHDAEGRYEAACERRAAILAMWEAEGRPAVAYGSMGQLSQHPLLRELNDLDVLCDRLAAPLLRRHRGPAPSAVLTPSVGKSPVTKLRKVG